MVLWPVRAALRGRRRARRRRRLARAGARRRAAGGRRAGGAAAPDGTGGAVAAAMAQLDAGATPATRPGASCSAATCRWSSAEAIASWSRRTQRSGAAATMATTVLDDPSGYGRVVRDADGAVSAWSRPRTRRRDAPRSSQIHEVNTGIYAFDGGRPARGAAAPERRQRPGRALPAAGARPAARRRRDGRRARASTTRRWCSASTTASRWRAVRALAQRAIHERHMLAGVDDRRPGGDRDRRRRGDRPGHDDRAVHDDPRQHADRRAAARSRTPTCVDCVLEDGVSVGPFAYLRPGTVAARGRQGRARSWRSRTPTSAPARRCRTSPTSATPTSARARTSARRTITANYDGRAKHRTTIGERVRGGVDTTFVAPVTVGDDAYTAAGSVITEDVPRRRARRSRAPAPAATSRDTPSDDERAPSLHSDGDMSSVIDTRSRPRGRACRSTTTSG